VSNKIECPACGSNNVEDIKVNETRQLTLGTEFSYLIPSHRCKNCGEEGDFNGEANQVREDAMALAKENLAKDLINSISDSGLKLAYVERAFEIPQRTISSKWGTGKISASGLALLRIVKTMPWIVHIADHKFSKETIAGTIHSVWEGIYRDNNFPVTYSASYGSTTSVHVHITAPAEQKNKLTNVEVGGNLVPST